MDILLEEEIENQKDLKTQNLTQTLLLNLKDDYADFLVLILKPVVKTDYSKLNMFGIKGIDYIKNAVLDYEIKEVNYNLEDDIIKVIKNNLNNKKYVLVLFSDTPLIQKQTIKNIIDYFLIKKLCALQFNRGYAFECEYLKNVDKIYNPQLQSFNEEDFIKVTDSSSFSRALEILKGRIISYHQQNDVIFEDVNSVYIDAKANIEKNVIIKNNVNIVGKSLIKENSTLFNCNLNKVIIEEGCLIETSIVENSVIEKNCVIKDYSIIKNSTIKEKSVLENYKLI